MSDESTSPEQGQPETTPIPTPAPQPEAVDLSQDKIHVLLPDKSRQAVDMKAQGLSIGRSPENDIILSVAGISRHHARIEFDGVNYTVRDLKSMNGTFLGKQQLKPDTPYPWLPGEELHVGECVILLERASQGQTTTAMPPPQTQPARIYDTPTTRPDLPPISPSTEPPTPTRQIKPVVRPDGSVIEDSQVIYSQARTLGAYVYTPQITLTPGKPTTFSILMVNRGASADVFRIALNGVPPEWVVGRLSSYSLPAGTQRDVSITLQPPRTPESKAGRRGIVIDIASQNTPGQTAVLRISATVAAYTQFVSELRTRTIRSGRIGQVMVQNQGNLPDTFSLTLDDKEQELVFDPPQAKITIPPGGTAIIEFRATLGQPRLMGPEISHSFGAIVNSQTGQYQPHTGEVTSRGLLPAWAPILLVVLCILTLCGSILLYNAVTAPERHARQTEVAGKTELARMVLGTAVAQTQTVQALQNNATQTVAVATITASALQLDTDGDGLTNAQEITYGANPNDPDTDKDGLNDGAEVNQYKTFPLLPDSDGDGLSDGIEIQRGLNPLSRDTDNDGLPDNTDPDPGRAPTPTATFVLPATFTPTPTATPTPTQVPASADLVVTVDNGVTSSVPGRNTSYTIVVSNKGPSAVRNIQVENNFPGELQNVTWTCAPSPGAVCQATSGNGNIFILVDLPVNGKVTFVANAVINPNASGLLVNTAVARLPTGITELNSTDNTGRDTDSLRAQFSFVLTITDNKDTIGPGDAVSYTIVATNNGPSAAGSISIVNYFPTTLTGMTWTCNATAGSTCSPGGTNSGNVSVSANVMPGGSITIVANGAVSPSATGQIKNEVNLTSPVDPAINNRTASDVTNVVVKTDLRLTVDAPLSAGVNTVYTYTVTIVNNGPSVANNAVLTAALPAGVTFVQSTPGGPICSVSGSTLTCNLGSLPVGATVQVKVAVRSPGVGGMLRAEFEVRLSETEITPVDNRQTVDILIL